MKNLVMLFALIALSAVFLLFWDSPPEFFFGTGRTQVEALPTADSYMHNPVTTYYVEIFPTPVAELGGLEPIFALSPSLGEVDLVVATELMEAARCAARGWSSAERTHLIASTHRVHAVAEKMEMGDGRYDSAALLRAVEAGSRDRLLFDMEAAAKSAGCIVNAVLLGAVAGSGLLPIAAEVFEAQIKAGGKAVEGNLRGFHLGLEAARGTLPAAPAVETKRPHPAVPGTESVLARLEGLPPAVRPWAEEGVRRLAAYQDVRYAGLYVDRLLRMAEAGSDDAVLTSVARHLAVRMGFEDIIQVARLKSDPARLARIRAELGAAPDQPVIVRDFLKPGLEEMCALLPGILARPILAAARAGGWADKASFGLRVNAAGVLGHTSLRLLAALRPLRRVSHRWAEEQAEIESWLDAVIAAVRLSPALALEVAECARLIKGYGETWRRGSGHFRRIAEQVVAPALAGRWSVSMAADAVANARIAALSDPEGGALDRTLAALPA